MAPFRNQEERRRVTTESPKSRRTGALCYQVQGGRVPGVWAYRAAADDRLGGLGLGTDAGGDGRLLERIVQFAGLDRRLQQIQDVWQLRHRLRDDRLVAGRTFFSTSTTLPSRRFRSIRMCCGSSSSASVITRADMGLSPLIKDWSCRH